MFPPLIRLFSILGGLLLIIGGPFLFSYFWNVVLPIGWNADSSSYWWKLPTSLAFITSACAGILLAVYLLVQGFYD